MKNIFRIIITIAVVGLIGLVVYKAVNNNKTGSSDGQLKVVVQDQSQGQPQQSGATKQAQLDGAIPVPPAPTAPIPAPTLPSSSALPVVLPNSSQNPTASPAPKNITYRGVSGVTITMPSQWGVQQSVNGNRQVSIFYDKNNGTVYGQIESYRNTDDSLAIIEQQLQTSASVTNIQNTTIGGIPALQFTSDKGKIIAVVKNRVIFYISGALATGVNSTLMLD